MILGYTSQHKLSLTMITVSLRAEDASRCGSHPWHLQDAREDQDEFSRSSTCFSQDQPRNGMFGITGRVNDGKSSQADSLRRHGQMECKQGVVRHTRGRTTPSRKLDEDGKMVA
jgi:hypothetical protein